MREEEIFEGNKMIAEFMGAIFHKNWTSEIYKEPFDTYEFRVHPTEFASKFWMPGELRYNREWNWLMPVVEKIEGLDGGKYQGVISGKYAKIGWYDELSATASTKIEATLNMVIQFIKWYNKEQGVKEGDATEDASNSEAGTKQKK